MTVLVTLVLTIVWLIGLDAHLGNRILDDARERVRRQEFCYHAWLASRYRRLLLMPLGAIALYLLLWAAYGHRPKFLKFHDSIGGSP